jgi:flagellar basal-body rod protein FlgB
VGRVATTKGTTMGIPDIPILSMLRTKMAWHQARQRVLAENVANADSPAFRPHDLVQPTFDRRTPPVSGGISLVRTSEDHLAGVNTGGGGPRSQTAGGYEIRPTGNAVSLEDEMMKVAANQMDFQAATALYTHSLNLLKTALGKR